MLLYTEIKKIEVILYSVTDKNQIWDGLVIFESQNKKCYRTLVLGSNGRLFNRNHFYREGIEDTFWIFDPDENEFVSTGRDEQPRDTSDYDYSVNKAISDCCRDAIVWEEEFNLSIFQESVMRKLEELETTSRELFDREVVTAD